MCLNQIYRDTRLEEAKKLKYGWKVILCDNNGKYKGMYRTCVYVKNGWNVDTHIGDIQAFDSNYYKKGFHVYKTRRIARIEAEAMNSEFSVGYCVKKVEIGNVVAIGEQDGADVIVCRKFRFI